MAKKIAFVVTVFVLVFSLTMSIGCTVAWIFTSTDPVVNTFEYGDVNITLSESASAWDDGDGKANTNKYWMVPGDVLAKNPTVTVDGSSEDCYLFVKIVESDNFDSFLAYAIADGWKLYNTDKTGSSIDTADNDTYVLYREVLKNDSTKSFGILGAGTYSDGTFSVTWTADHLGVKTNVTKAQLNALGANYPTLTFTAHAVQMAHLTLAQAYAVAFPSGI